MRRYPVYIVVSLLVFFVFACSGEVRKVKNLVTVYNKVLIDAYLRPEPRLMENFTSKREYIRIESYIMYLLKNNKMLKGDLKELVFESVRVKGDEAEAVTKERWVYMYIDARTRKPVSKEYDAIFLNTYYLKKQGGRWVVDRLESEEVGGEGEAKEEKELQRLHKRLFEKMRKKQQDDKS
jgi:hypothetical protein